MFDVLNSTCPSSCGPSGYLMGVGKPTTSWRRAARHRHVRLRLPTRSGRTARLHLGGALNLRNARHAMTRARWTALFLPGANPTRGLTSSCGEGERDHRAMLLTWHNLAFFQDLVRTLREAIGMGAAEPFAARFLERYRGGEGEG